MSRIIYTIIFVFLLAACSSKPVEIMNKPIEKPKLSLDNPSTPQLNDIEFVIITDKNFQDVFEKLKKQNLLPVIVGLTEKNYKNLALNNAETRAYIVELRKILEEYKKYYEK